MRFDPGFSAPLERLALSMRAALECVTSHAAVSLHLPRKGSLASGFDGDVVLFDPHAVRRVEALRWRGAGRPPLCGAKKSV